MKIAIIGTHSVGKTTLAEDIEAFLKIPQKRADKARDFVLKICKGKRLDELDTAEQMQLQNCMLEAFREIEQSDGPFIMDGTSLTCVPYAQELIPEWEMDGKWLQWLKQTSLKAFQDLDYILYIPPELPLQEDGFRPKGEELRDRIDLSIRVLLGITATKGRKLCAGKPHPKVRIICGSRTERVNQASKLFDAGVLSIQGLYTFEGIPKAGKTTQINDLKQFHDVKVCPRIGVTPEEKERLNKLYENKEENYRELMESHIAAFKSSQADFSVHSRVFVGETVVMDRSRWTIITLHLAIQGWENFAKIMRATYGLLCGSIIWIKTPPEIAAQRGKREDDFSLKSDVDFQKLVHQNYACLVANIPNTYIVDGESNVENVRSIVRGIVSSIATFQKISTKSAKKLKVFESQSPSQWGAEEHAADLSFQVGNIHSLLLQKKAKSHQRFSPEQIQEKLGEELCDTIYHAAAIARLEGVELNNSWELKRSNDVNKIAERIRQNL